MGSVLVIMTLNSGLVQQEGRDAASAQAHLCLCGNKPTWRDMTRDKTKRDMEYTLFGCFDSGVHEGIAVVGYSIDTPLHVVEIWNSLVARKIEAQTDSSE